MVKIRSDCWLQNNPKDMSLHKRIFNYNHTVPRLFMVSLFVFVTILSNQGFAGQHAVKGKVRLASGEGYSPFVDNKLPDGGWSTSMIIQTFNKLNLDTSIEFLLWNRALKWTQDDKFLAAFPFVYSEPRAEDFLFSTPINFVPVHMYAASDSAFISPEQLKNKRFPFSYSLDSLEQGIVDKYQMNINRVKDGIGCVKHVQKGWSDAGLTNGYIQADKLPKNENNDISIVIFPEQLALILLHLVIGKDYPNAEQWLAEFDQAFSLLKKSGEKSAVAQRYIDLINAP